MAERLPAVEIDGEQIASGRQCQRVPLVDRDLEVAARERRSLAVLDLVDAAPLFERDGAQQVVVVGILGAERYSRPVMLGTRDRRSNSRTVNMRSRARGVSNPA